MPANKGRTTLTLRAYPFQVVILNQSAVIASHVRCYERHQDIFDPLHYLSLLTQRPGAFEYAKPIRQWRVGWPPVYEQALAQLRSVWPDGRGVREFIQILHLHHSHPVPLIEQAITLALTYGCVHYEGVHLCLNQLLMPSQVREPLDLEAAHLTRLQQPGSQPLDLQQYDHLILGA